MSYVEDLGRQLSAVGIRGRARTRVLAEIDDHLACDPGADLGDPKDLARRFADELGTSFACRSARDAFAGLAVGGVCFLVMGMTAAAAGVGWSGARFDAPLSGVIATGLAAVAAQVAFVAGALGMWRAWWLRREPVISRAQATVLGRRAGVGLASGIVALAALAVAVLELKGAGSWWRVTAVAGAGLGELALLAALPSALAAARVRPTSDGDAGDLAADLAPIVAVNLSARALGLWVAAAVAVAIAAAGVIGGDPFDGALRGMADGAACLGGFALLGRYLGLRR